MRRHVAAIVIALVALAASPPAALGQKKLGLGLYAPDVPFSGPAQRFSMVQALAKHLTNMLGVPVEGKAYQRARHLEQDVKAKKVHFAVLGAVYLASKPGYRVLAQARFSSKRHGLWSIMAKKKMSIAALKGVVLQVPNMGPRSIGLVQNGLLGGIIKINKHFKKVQRAPDVSSAIAAVRLGRAAAVLAPISTAGLVPAFTPIRIPPPGFVVLSRALPKAQVAKAASAVASYGAGAATIQNWRGGVKSGYSVVNAAAAKKTLKMALAPIAAAPFIGADVVNVKKLEARLPELETSELFWVP